MFVRAGQSYKLPLLRGCRVVPESTITLRPSMGIPMVGRGDRRRGKDWAMQRVRWVVAEHKPCGPLSQVDWPPAARRTALRMLPQSARDGVGAGELSGTDDRARPSW